ncbi:transposase [Acetobacterium tundrae]|uniref:Transposase n=1 Tax=Acetobacterium tundrae TaxID=132932 RepID=A0ABR6WLE2_9FIRM|nr:transposase [Acetobacterium tundrae]MBC3797251.1 transposase [Acetobacterium tundrae]
MPRTARQISSTGIYHIILRGTNRQIIFEDEEDYSKLMETLKKQKEISGIEIFAYCFMSNHIHLLIKVGSEDLGTIFRRVGASYVYWYNWKYNRRGHLFQDRYKSEAVEDDRYFLTVIRYIHQNPQRAGIVKQLSEYRWSSYNEYLGSQEICNIDFALNLFSLDRQKAIPLFKTFNTENIVASVLEYDQNIRWTDSEANAYIRKIAGVQNPVELQNFNKEKRNDLIKSCKNQGISIRQIERLTGISFGVIRSI